MASKTPMPTLDLDYHPDLGTEVLGALEQAARATGLPLWQVEALGQDTATALGFVAAVEAGDITGFVAGVDWDRLERVREERPVAVAVSAI